MQTEEAVSTFDDLVAGPARKYIMLSGKGGVGKTSLSASLGAKLAAAGHSVLVVSTDPAHSLGDSFDQVGLSPSLIDSHGQVPEMPAGDRISAEDNPI